MKITRDQYKKINNLRKSSKKRQDAEEKQFLTICKELGINDLSDDAMKIWDYIHNGGQKPT